MYYIVGLGNPGKEYQHTRHNVGFLLVRRLVKDLGLPEFHESSSYSGLVSEGILQDEDVTVLLPTTFMNASGKAVQKLVPKQEAMSLLVVYDDIDIPLGEIKISFGRGDGGHNGIKSIINNLGTSDFARVRIGIARTSIWSKKAVRPASASLPAYVLGNFSAKEERELERVGETLKEIVVVYLTEGVQKAMNLYN